MARYSQEFKALKREMAQMKEENEILNVRKLYLSTNQKNTISFNLKSGIMFTPGFVPISIRWGALYSSQYRSLSKLEYTN